MQGYDYIINAILAAGIAIIISIAMGPFMIPFLSRLKVGQSIREDGPQRHLKKAGTPTMGGIIIITAVMVSSFIMAGASVEVLLAVLVMLAFGGIGFWDDYIKVVLKRSLGLRAREKIGLQLLVGILFSLFLMFYLERGTSIIIPFSGNSIDLGYLYIPFLVFVLLASSNAVNLTDGLDGLASGITLLVALAFLIVSLMTAHYG
jgi:phospho-N-acetylmuramoyl-pentapeptide-transferase